jgi:hypothetical protein
MEAGATRPCCCEKHTRPDAAEVRLRGRIPSLTGRCRRPHRAGKYARGVVAKSWNFTGKNRSWSNTRGSTRCRGVEEGPRPVSSAHTQAVRKIMRLEQAWIGSNERTVSNARICDDRRLCKPRLISSCRLCQCIAHVRYTPRTACSLKNPSEETAVC